MAKHSFICNSCVYFDPKTDEELNTVKCENCNGEGREWQPINKDFYEKDPKRFMEYLILGSQ